jgi:hypothetical protein
MFRARWLAAAIVALSVVSCTGRASAGHESGSYSGWRTYIQPPGPMQLAFRYPPTWTVGGATFVSTMGNVGKAYVVGDTSATSAQFDTGCKRRVGLLYGSGVYILWGANIGSPMPMRLSQMPGRKVWVNGHPARLAEIKSRVCGPETVIYGTIQVAPHTFLFMGAEVGAHASRATLAMVNMIFFSARAT